MICEHYYFEIQTTGYFKNDLPCKSCNKRKGRKAEIIGKMHWPFWKFLRTDSSTDEKYLLQVYEDSFIFEASSFQNKLVWQAFISCSNRKWKD